MDVLSKVKSEPGTQKYMFFCPGCKCAHYFTTPDWSFNDDMVKPTVSPSILTRTSILCHSFVRDGNIQFLTDCEHELAGETVALGAI